VHIGLAALDTTIQILFVDGVDNDEKVKFGKKSAPICHFKIKQESLANAR